MILLEGSILIIDIVEDLSISRTIKSSLLNNGDKIVKAMVIELELVEADTTIIKLSYFSSTADLS